MDHISKVFKKSDAYFTTVSVFYLLLLVEHKSNGKNASSCQDFWKFCVNEADRACIFCQTFSMYFLYPKNTEFRKNSDVMEYFHNRTRVQ